MRSLIVLACLIPSLAAAQRNQPAPGPHTQDAKAAAAYFTLAAKKLPSIIAAKSTALANEGVGVLLLDSTDPAVVELGAVAGKGFFHLSEAIRKDMIAVVQKSQPAR